LVKLCHINRRGLVFWDTLYLPKSNSSLCYRQACVQHSYLLSGPKMGFSPCRGDMLPR